MISMFGTRQGLFLPQPPISFRGMLGRRISPPKLMHTPSAPRSVPSWSQGSAVGGGTKAPAAGALPRDSDFFNREREQESLNRQFDDTPGVITVVVGPPDCGKTVRSALAVFARAAGTSFPIVFINLLQCTILPCAYLYSPIVYCRDCWKKWLLYGVGGTRLPSST